MSGKQLFQVVSTGLCLPHSMLGPSQDLRGGVADGERRADDARASAAEATPEAGDVLSALDSFPQRTPELLSMG